jgi:hypothetical protein
MKIIGFILIVAGLVALIYGGYSYTTQKKLVDTGALQISRTEHETIPIPPLLGVVAILGGGALVYFGAQKSS